MLKALSVSEGFREFGPEILENSDERKETHENTRDGELLRARSDLVLGGGSTDSINRLLGLHPGGEDLSPTVQASSSYFSFSGISSVTSACSCLQVSGVNQRPLSKSSKFSA